MTTYNTAYKSGTITAISGATLTVSGMTPAAGDVGRILVLTSGSGELQHREIVGVSGQDMTLAHSFDTNPFIDNSSDSRGTDVNPSASDTFAISYNVSDLIAGDADITLDDQNHLLIAAMTAQTGAYIHFNNYHVQLNSTTFKSGNGGGFIFGYYNYVANEDAYTKSACHIVDVASGTAGDQMRVGANDFGMFDVYGGSIYCPSDLFWRLYWDTGNGDYQARFFDISVQGGLGGRLDGDRSLLSISVVGDNNTFGIFNVLSNPFRNEVIALSCFQAGYVNLLRGSTGRAVFNRLADISAKVLNVALGGSGGPAASAGNVYEVVGKKSEIDAAPAFITVDSTGAPDHTVRYGNIISPRFITQNLSLLTGNIATSLLDTNGTLVSSQNVTDGVYPPAFHRHTDLASVAGAQLLSDGTQYAPYALNAVKYGYQFSSSSIALEDTYNPDLIFLADSEITEPSKAVVDAYTEANNNAELYDAQMAWLEDNLTTETAPPITRSGNAGSFNIFVDANALQPYDFDGSTITVGSNAFNGSLTTTGTLTLLNGAVVVDATASITGIVAGSRLRIYNVTTATEVVNEVVAGTSYSQGYISGGDYSVDDVINVALTYQDGTSAKLGYSAIVVATSGGWSVLASQQDDAVYNTNAIDGSGVTKFTADYVDEEIDIAAAGNFTSQEFYAWWVYNLTTEQGVRNFFGGYTAEDAANYRNNVDVVSIYWDNLTTTNVYQTDSARIYRSDGQRPVKNGGATTGGGGVDLNWREKVFLATTGGGPLTPTQEARLLSCATEAKQDTIISDIADLPADIDAELSATHGPDSWEAGAGSGGDDAATIYAYFTDGARADAFKAEASDIADGILNRSISGGSNGGRTVMDSLRASRNKVVVDRVAGTITVYEEDDATVAWSGAVQTERGDPISSVDPS